MTGKDDFLFEKTNRLMEELLSDPLTGEVKIESVEIRAKKDQPLPLIEQIPVEHREKVYQLARQIDPANHEAILTYGTEAQEKLLTFSHVMIEHVQKKDVGEVGQIINELMKKLEQVNPDDLKPEKKSFLSKIFGKISGSIQEALSKYQKTSAQIDRIAVQLERSKNALLSDINYLEKLYEVNKEYFQMLNIYIAAGELKLEELHKTVIPNLRKQAEAMQDQMKAQEVNDMIQFANRLEKRLHDLKLSREITLQSAPQIRLIQHTNQTLVEKIQTSINTAIPLWKNQVAIALTLLRQRHAVQAQQQVSKTTNELLLRNAEMLKTNTIEAARENERGLVDIETLKKTQESLIMTLEETLRIQEEGRKKRLQAEKELAALEENLRKKLLEFKGNN